MSTAIDHTPQSADATPDRGAGGPWRRWFARSIDMWTVGVALNLILPISLTLHYVREDEPFALWLRSYFGYWAIYIIIEALVLASFGFTLGKRLLGLRVETPDGQRPRFGQALVRTFRCWLMGMGTGFPLFAWVTMPVAYRRLRREGVTPWDRATGLEVHLMSRRVIRGRDS